MKFTIKDTPMWRLLALDGSADIAHVSKLIAISFGYPDDRSEFVVDGVTYSAGCGGVIQNLSELAKFDSLIENHENLSYYHGAYRLSHTVEILKAEPHLYCLMPSCLIGSGMLPKTGDITTESICALADSDNEVTVNIKEITNIMRALGSVRIADKDNNSNNVTAIDFKVEN
ncbi:MAG: hypothetical protein ACI4NE_06965 [Succinivibrio sp.]